jgi:hypothetical protein
MVLVSDKPSNTIGIVPTPCSPREGHAAGRLGLDARPRDQHLQGGQGARPAGGARRPRAGPDPGAMAPPGPPGAPRLPPPAVWPRAALTPWARGRLPRRRRAAGSAPAAPRGCALAPAPLPRRVRPRGGGPLPRHAAPPWLEPQTEGAPDPPARRGAPGAAALGGAPACAARLEPRAAIRVPAPQPRRSGHAERRPGLLGRDETAEAGALRAAGAAGAPGARQPARARPVAPACAGRAPAPGDALTGPEGGRGGWGPGAQRRSALVAPGREQRHRGQAALLSGAGCPPEQRGGVVRRLPAQKRVL